jgi:hypothetical protein
VPDAARLALALMEFALKVEAVADEACDATLSPDTARAGLDDIVDVDAADDVDDWDNFVVLNDLQFLRAVARFSINAV